MKTRKTTEIHSYICERGFSGGKLEIFGKLGEILRFETVWVTSSLIFSKLMKSNFNFLRNILKIFVKIG